MKYSGNIDELVEHFALITGTEVKILVEIEVASQDGFDEFVQRTIKENCNVLRFSSSEFEGE